MKDFWEGYKIGMLSLATGIACISTLLAAVAGVLWLLDLLGVL